MNGNILIVDDSASMRSVVKTSLEKNGYSVMEAINGEDAFNKLNNNTKLVITDLNMPVMNGIDLLKKIRSDSNLRTTPVLILTTESAEDLKTEGKNAGATGWIVKPFNEEKLLSVLKKLI